MVQHKNSYTDNQRYSIEHKNLQKNNKKKQKKRKKFKIFYENFVPQFELRDNKFFISLWNYNLKTIIKNFHFNNDSSKNEFFI